MAERTPAAFAALAHLVSDGGRVALVTVEAPPALAGFAIDRQASVLQMVLAAPLSPPPGPASLDLGDADIPDMLDLAERTQPGPFGPRTIDFGRYIGLRLGGALAAMAGERMRFARFVEISAVCVGPAHRGKGYAALLMARLAEAHRAQGLTSLLHVFSDNRGAIALYEKLGFVARRPLNLTVLRAQKPRERPMTEPVIPKLAAALKGAGVYSAWVGINDPQIAETLAREDFDAVTLDMQHGSIDLVGAARAILSVALAGKPTVVRVGVGDFANASRMADAGAAGVIAPMINSAADARDFADFMKLPPLGRRSWGAARLRPAQWLGRSRLSARRETP